MTTVQRLLTKTVAVAAVHMKQPRAVESLIDNFVNDGPAKLQVITNFDLTLTCGDFDGSPGASLAHNVVHEHMNRFNGRILELQDSRKTDLTSWWRQPLDLFPSAGITKTNLETMIWDARVHPRAGVAEMFRRLEWAKVPVTVCSSGITDFIEIFLRQRLGFFPSNLTVVANKMLFEPNANGGGQVIGYQGPMIDPANKHKVPMDIKMSPKQLKALKRRHNILLLGCSLDDAKMHEPVATPDSSVLRVGFVGSGYSHLVSKFMDVYDVVLTENTHVDIPLEVVDEIVTGPSGANWA